MGVQVLCFPFFFSRSVNYTGMFCLGGTLFATHIGQKSKPWGQWKAHIWSSRVCLRMSTDTLLSSHVWRLLEWSIVVCIVSRYWLRDVKAIRRHACPTIQYWSRGSIDGTPSSHVWRLLEWSIVICFVSRYWFKSCESDPPTRMSDDSMLKSWVDRWYPEFTCMKINRMKHCDMFRQSVLI